MIGVLIRRTRERRGWSVADLASAARTSVALVEHLEAGRAMEGRRRVLKGVLSTLGITPTVLWDHALNAAETTPDRPVEFGWALLSLDVAIVAGPVPGVRALDELLAGFGGDIRRPPGLIVVRDPQWAKDGEEKALEVASDLSGCYGPAYQVRTSETVALVWDPSLVTLTQWRAKPLQARMRIPAGTRLTLTTDPAEIPPPRAGVLVLPPVAGSPPTGVGVRAVSMASVFSPQAASSSPH